MAKLDIRYTTAPNGARVAYGVAGSGPVVLIAPSTLLLSDFQNVFWTQVWVDALADEFTVATFDLPGSGLSDSQPRDYSLQGTVGVLGAVLDELGSPAVVWAPGASGPAAVCYAASHPERVTGLVLQGFIRASDYTGTTWFRSWRPLFDGEWDFAIDAFARMLVRFPEEQMPVAQHLRSVTTQDAYCEFLDAAADHDATCCAPLVWVPTLIMHHEGSRICDMVRSREMLTMIPGALRIEVMTALEGLDQEFLAGTALRFAHEVMTLPSAAGPDALTHREHLVLNLVGSGKSNVEIAADLSISRKTVERHVHNIYAKIGVHNRVEAANWAREHGVV